LFKLCKRELFLTFDKSLGGSSMALQKWSLKNRIENIRKTNIRTRQDMWTTVEMNSMPRLLVISCCSAYTTDADVHLLQT
jgi:hypothetical protein